MSVTTISKSGLNGEKNKRTVMQTLQSDDWVRPADWLPLPEVNEGDQKFVGLHAVFDREANFVAISAADAYTVDWGDGTPPENIGYAGNASHNYVFSSLSPDTLTSEGYRQAIVTVTPQGAGNLSLLNLCVRNSKPFLTNYYISGWLDVCLAAPYMVFFTISDGTATVRHGRLQQFTYVGPSSITTFQVSFYYCTALRKIVGTEWISKLTTFAGMFSKCSNLKSIPLLDTSAGTSFSQMFMYCTALESIPMLDTSAGTNFTQMFAFCNTLKSVPLLDTSAGTNFTNMFNSCSSLKSIPLLDTALGLDFSSMFASCPVLETIPLLDTAAGKTYAYMFSYCYSLQSVPLLDTSAGTDFSSMFSGCNSLLTVPLFNTALGKNFQSMFGYCLSLESIPLFNTAAGTNFSYMFSGCLVLKSIPLFNTAAGTNFTQMFNGCNMLCECALLNVAAATSVANLSTIFGTCNSLAVGALFGTRFAIDYKNCLLSGAELDRIYENLGVASGAQSITVRGNWGLANHNPAIATAKGWTVITV